MVLDDVAGPKEGSTLGDLESNNKLELLIGGGRVLANVYEAQVK